MSEDLKYVGDGRFLVGIPARDLTADEIEERGLKAAALKASGLYERQPKETKARKDDKDT